MSDGPPGEYRPRLKAFARVVTLPDDDLQVHLVIEVVRAGRPTRPADYMAPSTVCRGEGFADTDRVLTACPECERGMGEAVKAAMMTCASLLIIRDAVSATN